MGLFKKFPVRASAKSDPLDRLTPKGELPWGWCSANREFTEQIEAEYRYFSDNVSKAKTVLEKYGALKSLVQYREDVKNLCKAKGECFEYWAFPLVADPDITKQYDEELKYMEEHIDELLKQEELVKQIRKELPKIIKAEPGVIQSDLYKRYEPCYKNIISNELYHMESCGKIKREKSGRSYALYIK